MPLPVTPEQKATISPQAVEFLSAADSIPMEAISNVAITRQMFQATEDVTEESLIENYSLDVKTITISDVPVLVIRPPSTNTKYEGKVAFNIHGGGFVMGTARDRTALMIAGELGLTVYSVGYTLSPEVVYPTAVEQCLSVYREVIIRVGAENIVGTSSSAGGQIMLSTIIRAQREQLLLPAALAFYTPNVDLSGVGDSNVFNNDRDLIRNDVAVQAMSTLYAGGVDLKNELLSPIYAELRDPLPPTVINTGGAARVGGYVAWINWELELPEGIRAREAVYSFIRGILDKN